MAMVIGLDFGNYKSFPCIITDMDEKTRLGGDIHDLLPQRMEYGIPSVFFYSQSAGVLCGELAVRNKAKPVANRVRYLKRHLGEPLELDGKMLSYDLAITSVIQHCVRAANEQLSAGFQSTTNLISLSYPASYTKAQLMHLKGLAEKATLADGRHVKVYGTIAEPAAAALDYLATSASASERKDSTVLVYDLGGGTFDLALVSVYPNGRKNKVGETYYYDVLATRGLGNLGGKDFDEVMYHILEGKFNVPLRPVHREELRNLSESTKIDLTDDDDTVVELGYGDDYLTAHVTKAEFEAAAKPLLQRTIDATKEMLSEHPEQKPDIIVLTGGASRMPMVKNAMVAALGEYRDRIKAYRPERSIAYGAARYGTTEENIVQQRVMYDIGIRYFSSTEDKMGFVQTLIPAGTFLPVPGEYRGALTLYDNSRYLKFSVREAIKTHPDINAPESDFVEIMYVTLDFETQVPAGTRAEVRVGIDSQGIVTVEARDPKKPGNPPVSNHVELKNLSR